MNLYAEDSIAHGTSLGAVSANPIAAIGSGWISFTVSPKENRRSYEWK